MKKLLRNIRIWLDNRSLFFSNEEESKSLSKVVEWDIFDKKDLSLLERKHQLMSRMIPSYQKSAENKFFSALFDLDYVDRKAWYEIRKKISVF